MMTPHERAKAWRNARGFSIPKLAAATGYSMRSISGFEAGLNANGKPLAPEAMHRYRLACAAVEHGLAGFDWPTPNEGAADQ